MLKVMWHLAVLVAALIELAMPVVCIVASLLHYWEGQVDRATFFMVAAIVWRKL